MENKNLKYYIDDNIRNQIDILLKENAALEANIGIETTNKEYGNIKVQQDRIFNKIKELDLEFYNIITYK